MNSVDRASYPRTDGGGSHGFLSSGLGDTPDRQTAFNEVASAMCDARLLAVRVSSLVDRFCGGVPTAEDSKGKGINQSTILGDLRIDAERTAVEIRHAMDRLNVLERELP